MIVRVGVDAVALARFERCLRDDDGFSSAFLTPLEAQAVAASVTPTATAARWFAAKEAIVKALGVEGSAGMLFKDIELRGLGGRITVRLKEGAEAAARRSGVECLHVATCVCAGKAFAVAVGEKVLAIKERE